MYDRLLVPLDGSLPAISALHAADRLADRWGAEITVLTLVRDGAKDDGLDEMVARQAEQIGGTRTIDVRQLSYSVGDDIAAAFDEVPNTLIVMSTGARGRSAGLNGNVSEDVLRQIRHPMLLLGHHDEIGDDWPSGRLLVCLDGSDFSQNVLPLAAQWADALDLTPTIVGMIDPSKVPAGIPSAAESNMVARAAAVMEGLTTRPVDYDTLHGSDPAKAIVDYADHANVALIALATHGRSGADRVLHGSVAMGVIRHGTQPVLVIRPAVDPHD